MLPIEGRDHVRGFGVSQKHKIRIEQLRQVEVDLNAQIVAKNEEIEALQDSFDKERKRFELERFALTQHIDKIGEELKVLQPNESRGSREG